MHSKPDDRTILAITGEDRSKFLQGLTSNAVPDELEPIKYTALLTPQGKYLVDFLMIYETGRILIDVANDMAAALQSRLSMYKLRAAVDIETTDIAVERGLGDPPAGALPDPRHPDLGWRRYGAVIDSANNVDWDAIRVRHCIPQTGIELIPNETYILEAGFERLNGVDFKKGCYVGQEVTARMKHKTELKKGLATVRVDGTASVGTDILADGKPAGTLFTQSGGHGIAYLRFARATVPMTAGQAAVTYQKPKI